MESRADVGFAVGVLRKLVENGTTVFADAARPIQLLEELLAQQQLTIGAIQHIEESIAIGLQHQLARAALPIRIDQHGHFLCIPVVNVVRRELVIPLELTGLCFQRQDRIAIQVVAFAIIAIVVGAGVAGSPVHKVKLRIVSAGHPRRARAMLGVLALPCFRSRLARLGHRPESPHFLTGGLIVGTHKSTSAFIAARQARDDQVADHQRGRRPVIVLVPVRHLCFPQ